MEEEGRQAAGNGKERPTPAGLVPAKAAPRKDASAEGKEGKSNQDETAIWDADEVDTPHVAALKAGDDRQKPEFDIVYKQSVGSETVYFGMDDVDPSSNCCQEIVIKIKLPGQLYKDLNLDVQRQSMVVTSPDYRLATYLPYPVDHEAGSAKWDGEAGTLSITLPIVEEG